MIIYNGHINFAEESGYWRGRMTMSKGGGGGGRKATINELSR